jgi:hypothetical protein
MLSRSEKSCSICSRYWNTREHKEKRWVDESTEEEEKEKEKEKEKW